MVFDLILQKITVNVIVYCDFYCDFLNSIKPYSNLKAHSLISSTVAFALKRSPVMTFAPFARLAIFSPDEPILLEPEVAKGIIVFPEKSYCSAKIKC